MSRSASRITAAVAAVLLLAVSCNSDGGGGGDDASGGASDQADITSENLYGSWVTEDGAVTLEFAPDDSTLTFTTADFEACESLYEHRVADGEVDLDIECEASGDTAEECAPGQAACYDAEWTLTWSTSGGDEMGAGPVHLVALAGGLVLALEVETVTENEGSSVRFPEGVVFTNEFIGSG